MNLVTYDNTDIICTIYSHYNDIFVLPIPIDWYNLPLNIFMPSKEVDDKERFGHFINKIQDFQNTTAVFL